MRRYLLRLVFLSLLISLFSTALPYSQEGSADGLIGDPAWTFKFKPPAGWLYQLSSEGAMLGHNTIPGMILLLPHPSSDMQQMQQEMQEGIQEEGSYLMLEGSI